MPMKARNDGSQEIHVIVDSMIGHDRASPVDHGYWIPAWKHCGLNADWNERAWRLSPGSEHGVCPLVGRASIRASICLRTLIRPMH